MHGFMQSCHLFFLSSAFDHCIKKINRGLRSLMKIISKRDPDWWLHSSPVKGRQNSSIMRVIPRKGDGSGLFGIGKGICKHEIIAAETSTGVRHTCRQKFYSSWNNLFWTDLCLLFSFLCTLVLEVEVCPLCHAIFWNCRLR